jgi:hypothetical protein
MVVELLATFRPVAAVAPVARIALVVIPVFLPAGTVEAVPRTALEFTPPLAPIGLIEPVARTALGSLNAGALLGRIVTVQVTYALVERFEVQFGGVTVAPDEYGVRLVAAET